MDEVGERKLISLTSFLHDVVHLRGCARGRVLAELQRQERERQGGLGICRRGSVAFALYVGRKRIRAVSLLSGYACG